MAPRLALDHDFVAAFPELSVRTNPEEHPELTPVVINDSLATELGLDSDWLRSPEGAQFLAGHLTDTFATAYAGHQFGSYSPMLGDGRALLLGRVFPKSAETGPSCELMSKGTGPTAFSRRGDGRMVLRPALREYLVSEALHALGIPTTRCLAVLTTGLKVMRRELEPGAIVVRVARSHVRVGTFEYAIRTRQDSDLVDRLIEYSRNELYPTATNAEELFGQVCQRQAALVASWLRVGFVHGVLNTDNICISGETIDFGPCAFADTYDPGAVFSSIDTHGRYALGNQVPAMQWNLARWAETLLPRIGVDTAQEILHDFPTAVRSALGSDAALLDRIAGTDTDLLSYRRAHNSPHTPWFIPRNWQLEHALNQAFAGDMTEYMRLYRAVTHPYDWHDEFADLASPVEAEGNQPFITFCGT
ncbi:protein adenylyltransferase SelO family protein [Corynebacterium renale]|uniref:Protein nucleotidyltransferase YdiU n=1 Tax=Corynebacterium renale TaxID=1724 RepID=A0A2A9DPJ0_9CORY|nr:protein adenylyltransferase SelO family protein [Corynebacterium renale]PFG28514.1 uncharacterized protein YdiU (UPF0061 family) [Corynebacterium renale]SQI26267.1 Uncharacterized conserved protein [Corynebacterium renale]